MALYEIVVLGDPPGAERALLLGRLTEMVADFGLAAGSDLIFRDGQTLLERNRKAASVVAYYCSGASADEEVLASLIADSVPIVPIRIAATDTLPAVLQKFNALTLDRADAQRSQPAVALLECIGLLREQRRAFISYRRAEAREVAIHLHDVLSARGFDVFLDTHDIRPGTSFPDALWQNLCDSDVLVMLDTEKYFESKWTRAELGRALAKDIHVLRVVWPERNPPRLTDLSETVFLQKADLIGPGGPLLEDRADSLAIAVESIRSRSIAARYLAIAGKLRVEVEKIGGELIAIGANRAMILRLPDGREVSAYPVVGVPTAKALHEVATKAASVGQKEALLVYDHMGLSQPWLDHLAWLDEQISVVRAVRVFDAGWRLAGPQDG